MEKLILKCGRYITPAVEDVEYRVKLMEAYLAMVTEELEFLVGEMDRALNAFEQAIAERDALVAAEDPVAEESADEGDFDEEGSV